MVAVGCSSSSQVASMRLDWVAEHSLEQPTFFSKSQVGGLSGIYFDQRGQVLVALSDDPGMDSTRGPGRYYDFDIDVSKNIFRVTPKSVTKVDGFLVGATDLEAIAPAEEKGWLLSLEAETDKMNRYKMGELTVASHPRLLKLDARGKLIKEFLLPSRFQPNELSRSPLNHGVVLNMGVEGLSPIADGFAQSQWAMITEAPLMQDKAEFPNSCRLTLFSFKNDQWNDTLEFIYPLSAPPKNIGFLADIAERGVSEVIYLGDGKLWVLERSYFFNKEKKLTRNYIEIYEVNLKETNATPTGSADKLNKNMLPLSKKRVANLDDFVIRMATPSPQVGHILDNVEGMTLGPKVDGHDTLILVTDDNFSKSQRTVFRLFKILNR